jgi:hypothetical protein
MLMNIKDDNDNDRFNLMKQLQTINAFSSHSDGFETLRIFTEKCPNISPLEGDQVCRNDQIDNQNPLLGSNFDKLTTFPTTSHEQTHVVRSCISAMVYNKDKMTPVHFFLLQKHHKPNQNQLKFLNYVINNIPYGKQALKMYDCNDDLPIHIALKNYAISTNVIQSLVNQMDTLDYFLTPSHLDTPTILHLPDLNTKTLEMLVGIAPEEVFTTVDLDGRNPLHKLIEDSAGGPMLSIAPGIAVSIFLKSKNSHLSIYMEDYQGNTPIHLILQFLPNCVEKIVEIDGKNLKKCLIMVDKYRQTPLHSAAQYCDVDTIAFLVGVDWVVESFSMVDSRGRLPMHLMLIYQEDDDVYISLEDIIMKYSDRL